MMTLVLVGIVILLVKHVKELFHLIVWLAQQEIIYLDQQLDLVCLTAQHKDRLIFITTMLPIWNVHFAQQQLLVSVKLVYQLMMTHVSVANLQDLIWAIQSVLHHAQTRQYRLKPQLDNVLLVIPLSSVKLVLGHNKPARVVLEAGFFKEVNARHLVILDLQIYLELVQLVPLLVPHVLHLQLDVFHVSAVLEIITYLTMTALIHVLLDMNRAQVKHLVLLLLQVQILQLNQVVKHQVLLL